MIVDKNGKLFGKISLIDLLVVVLVLVGILAVAFRLFAAPHAASAVEGSVTYQLTVQDVRVYTVDAIREGQALYDCESGKMIGTVRSVVPSPHHAVLSKADGTTAEADVPNRYDVTLTVSCPATVSGDSVVTESGRSLYRNQIMTVYTQTAQFEARLTALERAE